MEIGKTIKVLRVAAGLKQTELARRVGVTPNYLSLVENERREPSLSFLRSVSEELDVPVGLLFLSVDTGKTAMSKEKQALLKRIRELILEIERLKLDAQWAESDAAR